MAFEDDETLKLFIEESQEHLSDIEGSLLEIESGGADIDVDLVNKVFRAIHSIKGGSGFFGLDRIKDLAHDMENVLNMIRNRELVPTMESVNALLEGADLLNEMVNDVGNSNDVDISAHLTVLQAIAKGETPTTIPASDQAGVMDGDASALSESETNMTGDGAAQDDGADDAIPGDESILPLPDLPFDVKADEIKAALRQYEHFYRVTYDLDKDLRDRNRTPLQVLQELNETGSVLGCNIDLSAEELPPDVDQCILL